MADDGRVVYRITGDNSQAMQAIDEFEDSARETAENTEGAFSDSAKKIAASIGAAFSAKKMIDFGKYAVGVASDLSEVQNVVDTTFGAAGAQRINEWAKGAAEAFGESELQAKQFTSTIGAMVKSMGGSQEEMEEMSIGLAGLAGDMASFYNLDPTEAFEKLRAGISGETEPLKQLGINMSVVNLEAYAMTQGITKSYEEMTQAEQATLRYQYIMQATADAQGDFSKTSDSFANQTRILQLELQTLAAEIGEDLLPIALELVEWVRDAIEWGTEHKKVLEAVGGVVLALTAGFTAMKTAMAAESLFAGVRTALNGIATAGGDANTSIGNLSGTFGGLPGYAAIAVAAIGLVVAALIELKEAQEEALNKQLEYMDSFDTLADYQANGLIDASGRIDYTQAERMKEAGTFKKADTSLDAVEGRRFYENKWGDLVLTARHQSGEDFVMADWTPAYLDYGERVLTRQENAEYTAMGGVEGMRQAAASAPSSPAAPAMMQIGLKVVPREMAHAITPYIVDEIKRTGG